MRNKKTMSVLMAILLSLLVGCSEKSTDKMSPIKTNIAVGAKLEDLLEN